MRTIMILVSAVALAGCAPVPSNPYYGPLGGEGGYSSLRRSTDKWAVRYTGNEKMTGSTVRDLTLLTCADIATEAGYTWFAVLDKVDESAHITEGTSFSGGQPAQPVTRQPVIGNMSGGVDTLTGSQSVNTRFISQYLYEIECYQKEPTVPEAYEAAVELDRIRTKYSIPERSTEAMAQKEGNH